MTPEPETGELLPCPFCGSAARFDEDADESSEMHGAHWIECSNKACAATTNAMFSCKDDCRPLLAEKWNRRADEQEMAGVLLAEANQQLKWATELLCEGCSLVECATMRLYVVWGWRDRVLQFLQDQRSMGAEQ